MENQQAKETKKRGLEQELRRLEQQIHDLEGAYLEETSQTGNILAGFDNYMKKASATQGGGGSLRCPAPGPARFEKKN